MSRILRMILNHKRITRNQIAKELHLSSSSIINYTKSIIDTGLIRETSKEISTGGRRPVYLELDPEVGLNIAIVMDSLCIKGALVNFVGEVQKAISLPAYQGIPKERIIDMLFELINSLVEESQTLKKRLFGIGVGLGGYIDPEKGISLEKLDTKNWTNVHLKELVEKKFNIPCFLINDTNACALGEKYYGRGVGVDHFICVWMGAGIGMGIVTQGMLYRGEVSYAGELGHTRCIPNGPLCFCGHRGCLETVTSLNYVMDKCKEGLSQGVYSEIRKFFDGDLDNLLIEHVIKASNNGDRFARNLFEEIAVHLGNKLSDVANILNPSLIILRGPVIDDNQFLFDNVERIVMNQSLRPTAGCLRLAYSEKRDDIRVQGIGSEILLDFFQIS